MTEDQPGRLIIWDVIFKVISEGWIGVSHHITVMGLSSGGGDRVGKRGFMAEGKDKLDTWKKHGFFQKRDLVLQFNMQFHC